MSSPTPTNRPGTAFASLEHEVYLTLQRLAADLGSQTAERLKGADLSPAQFNVLRILRGAGKGGLTCGEIGERLITRDSDVTRLLDRLERQELVTRVRSTQDRRVVLTCITEKGRAMLADLDEPLAGLHRAQLGHLGPQKLRQLLALLGEASAHGEGVG
ncbi:MarR family winged helix-turn-helix transcriptional regulator [Deinococcus planocerae]|uniref:MarR family winged helix-turn-helix transcriptional regulator n=1 Tax=Deinococcus planocerae TaxID=1737569 RepID=UPI000C7F42F5|nr:MarR family transcriptional regulator [Deinococcus planocerae]